MMQKTGIPPYNRFFALRALTPHFKAVAERFIRYPGHAPPTLLFFLILIFGVFPISRALHPPSVFGAESDLIVSQAPPLEKDDQTLKEYRVKAGFIYNFAKFVSWPQEALGSSDTPFVLCVAGSRNVRGIQMELRHKTVKGKRIVARQCETPATIDTCHILFLPAMGEAQIRPFLQALKGRPVLTIGETDHFTNMGGMINFYLHQNRIRFEVNSDAAKKVGLNLGAQIRRIAENYKKREE